MMYLSRAAAFSSCTMLARWMDQDLAYCKERDCVATESYSCNLGSNMHSKAEINSQKTQSLHLKTSVFGVSKRLLGKWKKKMPEGGHCAGRFDRQTDTWSGGKKAGRRCVSGLLAITQTLGHPDTEFLRLLNKASR